MLNKYLKDFSLIFTGGILYFYIEILYRGYSHVSMMLCGGICFWIIGKLNDKPRENMSLLVQMFIGALIITFLEFITGMIVNVGLGLNVWDYSYLPFNFLGQICLFFSFIWFWMSFVCIVIDDTIKYYIFDEDKKRYTIFGK